MSSDKIRVEFKRDGVTRDSYATGYLINIKREGTDDLEVTVKVPVGDVSSKEFAQAVRALYLASLSFHHQVYDKLREELEALNRGKRDAPPLLEKDQRGS